MVERSGPWGTVGAGVGKTTYPVAVGSGVVGYLVGLQLGYDDGADVVGRPVG